MDKISIKQRLKTDAPFLITFLIENNEEAMRKILLQFGISGTRSELITNAIVLASDPKRNQSLMEALKNFPYKNDTPGWTGGLLNS